MPVYFPPNCTHLVQPVDHRVAAWIKKAFHTLYLAEEDEMYEAWRDYRENGSLCPQALRLHVLNWMSVTWQQLITQHRGMIRQAFLSTGCLITLKGEHKIKYLDIKDYGFTYSDGVRYDSADV